MKCIRGLIFQIFYFLKLNVLILQQDVEYEDIMRFKEKRIYFCFLGVWFVIINLYRKIQG